jgi:hypothetical protein
MTLDEKIEIAKSWIYSGKFTHKGLTYIRGVNTYSTCQLLSEIMTMPMYDLAHNFHDLMTTDLGQAGTPAKGFTIGKGKVLYWYVTPFPNSGLYRCLSSNLQQMRRIEPTKLITIHY